MNGTQNIFNEYFNVLRFKADMIDAPSQQLNRAMIVAFMAHVQHVLSINGFGNRRLQFKDLRIKRGELYFSVPGTPIDVIIDDIDNMLSVWEGHRQIGDAISTGLVKEFSDWLLARTMTVAEFKEYFWKTVSPDAVDQAVKAHYGTSDPKYALIWWDSKDIILDVIKEIERKN